MSMKRRGAWIAVAALALAPLSEAQARGGRMPDIRGTWAQVQVTTAKTELPVIGTLETTTTSLLITEIEREGTDYVLTEQVCQIDLTGGSDAVQTVISEAFARGVSGQKRTIKWFRDGDSLRYEQPKSWRASGVATKDASRVKLPTSPDDPRVRDSDEDGHPGLTVKIRGAVDGEIYVAERSWSVLTGKMNGRGELHGFIKWYSEQSVLEATSIFLSNPPESVPTASKRQNYFRMRKMAEGAGCADAQKLRKQLLKP
jgi:hypothetical protein